MHSRTVSEDANSVNTITDYESLDLQRFLPACSATSFDAIRVRPSHEVYFTQKHGRNCEVLVQMCTTERLFSSRVVPMNLSDVRRLALGLGLA